MERIKQLIGNDWVEAKSGTWMDIIDPATEEVVAQVPSSNEEDVTVAVDAAWREYRRGWSLVPPEQKSDLMHRFADLVQRDRQILGQMDCEDMGKPLSDAVGNVGGAVAELRYYAGLTDKIEGKTLHTPREFFGYTRREPFGVVAAIVPWNFPVNQAMVKIAPAIAAGNAIILKPASISPRSALHFGKLALEAGLPPGTLNVLTGPGSSVGRALVEHEAIERLSFTGSTESGYQIATGAASNFKKLTLELGGKTANIIMPDAKMDSAVAWAVRTAFLNTGQICTTGSRLLLHRDIKEAFLAAFLEKTKEIVVGDPKDPRTSLGPVCSASQYEKIWDYVDTARESGLTFVSGISERPRDRERGFYLDPTVLDNVPTNHKVAKEEIFGPVLSVFAFENEEDAIRIANDTDTGLSADLWTTNLSTAHRMADRLEAGIIWVNCSNVVSSWMPYGGYKKSGSGFESGPENIVEFTRLKTVVTELTGVPVNWPKK